MVNIQSLNAPSRQRGVSLIMAIFIIVALSLLGAAMLNLTRTGAETVAREVISARALFAAESGAQKMLNEIFPPGSSTAATSRCFDQPSSADWDGLVGCENALVDTDCDSVSIDGVSYFTITSVGYCGPAGDQAVRIVEVQAKDGA